MRFETRFARVEAVEAGLRDSRVGRVPDPDVRNVDRAPVGDSKGTGEELMRELIKLRTDRRETLVDITFQVRDLVHRSGIRNGLVAVYAQGSTAALMVQENWDDSVQRDVVELLRKLIPQGVWQHDVQDGNGDAHLKSGLVGPSETIPLIDGQRNRTNGLICKAGSGCIVKLNSGQQRQQFGIIGVQEEWTNLMYTTRREGRGMRIRPYIRSVLNTGTRY